MIAAAISLIGLGVAFLIFIYFLMRSRIRQDQEMIKILKERIEKINKRK